MASMIDRLWIANWRNSATVYAIGVTILAVGLWWLAGIWPNHQGLWEAKSTVRIFTIISPLAPFTGALVAYRTFCADEEPFLAAAILTSVTAILIGSIAFVLLQYIAGAGDGFDRMGWNYLDNLVAVPITWFSGVLFLTLGNPVALVIALMATTSWTLLYLVLRHPSVPPPS